MTANDEIWRSALEAVDIPLFVVDVKLAVIFANGSSVSLVKSLGFVKVAAAVEGKPLFELVPMLLESVGKNYDTLFATGVPQQDEHSYTIGNSTVRIQSQRFPIFSGQKVSHVITIIRDVTEYRATQAALRHSEETARAILNASTESILLTDERGAIITLNEVAAQRLGKSMADIIGKTGQELLPPEVWQRRAPYIREVLRTGKQARYRDVRNNIVFDYAMYPVLDDAGIVKQIAIFATDVTVSVAAQEELTRIRQAVESSSDAIGFADMFGRHVYANAAFQNLFGYTVEELNKAGGPIAAYRNPPVAQEVFDTIKAGKPWSGEVGMVTRDGRQIVVNLRADAIRDQNGMLIGLVGIHTDISSQRQAEEILRQSEERCRLQFQSVPVPTYVWDRIDGEFVLSDYNQAAVEITRGGILNFVGKRASEMYRDRPSLIADMNECISKQSTVIREMLYAYQSVSGEKFLQVYYVAIPPNQVMVHTIDLTDRKRVETELQSARYELEKKVAERTAALQKQIDFEALVRRLLTNFASAKTSEIDHQVRSGLRELAGFFDAEHAFTVLVSRDRMHYWLAHNWSVEGRYDFQIEYEHVEMGTLPWLEEQILSGTVVQLNTLDDFPRQAVSDRLRYEREGVKSALLVPLKGRGGMITGTIGLRCYARAIDWSDDHVRSLHTVGDAVANVLERKQAEEELGRNEQRLSLHVQQTPLAVIEWDTDFRVLGWNPAAQQVFGYTSVEAIGRHADFIVPVEFREHVDTVWQELLLREGGNRSTNENTTKDGKTIVCEWYNTPLTDAEGKTIGVASLVQNVTERIRAETELALAYEQLQVEREALKQKNIALQELVEQVEESKRVTAAQIQANIERIVLPVLERIGSRLNPQEQQYLSLARSSISEIVSPFVSSLESQFRRLSPREIEICDLVRRGYDSKQIADLRSSSVQTVLKQRKLIRKKLGLNGKKVNLATYLSSAFPAQKKIEKGTKII